LDRSGLAAAATAAAASSAGADADDSGNVDSEDDCSHEHTFARIVSPEASSIYSGMPDAIPSIIDDIRAMLQEAWNISEPKEWQLNAIFAMVYGLDRAFRRLLLVRRTGDGKSLVIYGLATFLRGVTFVLVPILALGSDQVSSVWSMVNPLAGVFAEHLDSIRERSDIVSMARFLKSLRHKDKYGQSIVLWVSPDTLDNDVWKLCIKSLMQNHLVSCFVVDECHYIHN
jgi:superfamily II DNA helicase RecQ